MPNQARDAKSLVQQYMVNGKAGTCKKSPWPKGWLLLSSHSPLPQPWNLGDYLGDALGGDSLQQSDALLSLILS